MPTYEYRCRECGHTFDRILKISNMKDPENEPCPECGRNAIQQSVTVPLNSIVDPYRLDGRVRHSEDFREVMKQVKKNKGHKIEKEY